MLLAVSALAAFASLRGTSGFQLQRGASENDDPDLPVALDKIRNMLENSDSHKDVSQEYQPPNLMDAMPKMTVSQEMTKRAISQMRLHPADKDKAFGGCGILAWKIGFESHKDWMQREAITHNLMKALKTWPDDKELQWLCGGALSSAALYHKGIAEEAGNEGFMEILMEMPKKWPNDPKMQTYSMAGNMMSVSENNRRRWVAAGGMRQAMTALFEWPHDHNVKLSVLTALAYAVQDDAHHFLQYGGQLLMMQYLQKDINDTRVIEEVLEIGSALANDTASWHVLLSEKTYIERVVKAMNAHKDDIFVQSAGCKNLKIFASDSATRTLALEAGATDVAVDVVEGFEERKALSKAKVDPLKQTYSSKYQPDVACVFALGGFTAEKQGRDIVMKARTRSKKGKNGWDFLDTFKYKHAYEQDVQQTISQVFNVLEEDRKAEKAIKDAKGTP